MTCAMRLQDPCDGAVACHDNAEGAADVPFCERHYFAWRGHVGPFAEWTRKRRKEWAREHAEANPSKSSKGSNYPKNLESSRR